MCGIVQLRARSGISVWRFFFFDKGKIDHLFRNSRLEYQICSLLSVGLYRIRKLIAMQAEVGMPGWTDYANICGGPPFYIVRIFESALTNKR